MTDPTPGAAAVPESTNQGECTAPRPRWVRCGSSSNPDAAEAIAEAMAALFPEGLAAVEAPALALAFLSPAYPMETMAGELQAALGSVPLIGCSTSGELSDGRSLRSSLVLWALGGAGFSVRVGVGQGESGSLRVASREAARCLEDLPSHPHRTLVLLADGLCGDQMEVVRGAYEVAGASVPLVGGCAGDDMAMRSTSQIFGAKVLNQAVVAAAIGSDSPIGIGVSHGWQAVGEPMLVTSSSGVSVKTLDDRPALDVYLETLKAPPEASASPEAFAAFAATHPLGIPRRDRIEIRYVAGADLETRSLTCIASLPQGGMTMFMEGNSDSVLGATETACREACDGLAGAAPIGMLLFDCVARRSVLESASADGEFELVEELLGPLPVAGFYTYGEIARTQGAGGFHNQTLVALALS
jgi:hypothetical protein